MCNKYIYMFDEGNAEMLKILGGKGANLSEMKKLSINIPNGFTISSECSTKYLANNNFIDLLKSDIDAYLRKLEETVGKKFNDPKNPLFVSVRSGAEVSMPGMMDTILNLGLNQTTVEVFAQLTNNRKFAYESYCRFLKMFGSIVYGIPEAKFKRIEKSFDFPNLTDCDGDIIKYRQMANKYIYSISMLDKSFDDHDTNMQLQKSIEAIFNSWNNDRAKSYRAFNDISDDLGTAVTVQEMVFGNLNDKSATGILFTRNPSNGYNEIYGEVLFKAQGEDLVDGSVTPLKIYELKTKMPKIYDELTVIAKNLEHHFKNVQDIEFTIEDGKLFILQTRNAKLTPKATLKIAMEKYKNGEISKENTLLMQDLNALSALFFPEFKENNEKILIASGLAAAPGSVSGKIVFDAKTAKVNAASGEDVILVRNETCPEDIDGIYLAKGILTTKGGMTSHAAVVARGFGKCCVTGSSDIIIDFDQKKLYAKKEKKTYQLNEGDWISLDGINGNVYLGKLETEPFQFSDDLKLLIQFADEIRKLKVMVNADTPTAAFKSMEFGVDGIGLCRTEHMFFEPERIKAMREMILAKNSVARRSALRELLPMQRGDFKKMYDIMKGKHITIRLLDPPLHEFLPKTDQEIKELSDELKIKYNDLQNSVNALKEINPMLGYRGCRLAVTYPEIVEIQTKAIIEAAIQSLNTTNVMPCVQIMIPLISELKELRYVKKIVQNTADAIIEKNQSNLQYKIGTMIEIPRAALKSDEIATESDFFSFGTNDLTQMTFGFSRDDAGKFLGDYYANGILLHDPFETLDISGVGKLMEMSVDLARKTKPDLECGICGEHGGDPKTIDFCNNIGIDYVSCSPFRVHIAKIAAAVSEIKRQNQTKNINNGRGFE